MPHTDPRVDAYIDQAAGFARSILARLRSAVHKACPDVTETIKWGMPFFEHHGPLCHMAAFKRHAAFGFWRAGTRGLAGASPKTGEAMGSFGRLQTLADVPADRELTTLIKQAAHINRAGVKAAPAAKRGPRPVVVPAVLTAALERDARAQATYAAFSPTRQREYADWIADAKTETTRDKRLAQAIEWLAEGKPRHWKYENC